MKKYLTRRALCASLAACAVWPALAQTWPTQPLKVIVPGPAGSAPDVMMRLIGDKVALHLGKPVVIDNRPGAGGIVGVQAMDSARDGHTVIFMLTGVAVITPMLVKAAKYDVLRDFTPIAGIGGTSLMLAASPAVKAATIPEMIKFANENPGKVVVGHPGVGTLGHLMAESFAQISKAKFLVVGFTPTTGPLALVNGDAQYYMDGIAVMLPFVKAGRVNPVAVFSPTVLPGLEAYKLAKDGLPGAEGMGYFGLMGPKNMRPDASQAISSALSKALVDPEVIARLREFATYPAFTDASTYANTIRLEQTQWSQVFKAAGMEAQ